MSLTAADVAEIMRLVENSNFDELSLELNGMKLHLRRSGAPVSGASVDGARSIDTPANGVAGDCAQVIGTPANRASGDGAPAIGTPANCASGDSAQAISTPANCASGDSTPANSTSSRPPDAAPPSHATRRPDGAPTLPYATPAAQPAATSEPTKPSTADPALHEVTAPLLGTFYRAPKPGAPPFVERGSAVEPDTVIAIIEVMKLMNSVRAGVQGTVVDILPADGALVEYGETILRVAKSG